MPRPGPSVTSGADLQPGSDSLFPSGFTGGGARPSAGSVGTSEIADGSVSGADLNLASVATALAGRSEFTGTYARKVNNTVVILGDSITQNNYSSFDGTGSGIGNPATGHSVRGYWTWAALRLGHRMTLLYNAGVGGNTLAQILARVQTDVVAYNPGWCVVEGGRNSVSAAVSESSMQSDLTSIWTALLNAGIRVVATTITPRDTDDTATQAVVHRMNAWIRAQARSTRGVVLCDWYPYVADATTGLWTSGYSYDGLHPSATGAAALGRALAVALAPHVPDAPYLPGSNADTTNLLGNGLLTGTSGSKVTGITGSVATGWTADLTSGSITAVASKVTRTDGLPGEWQRFAVSANGTGSLRLWRNNTNVGTDWAIGDSIRARAEISTDSAFSPGARATLLMYAYNGSAALTSASDLFETTESLGSSAAGITGVLETPRLVIPTGTVQLWVGIRVNGTTPGQFDIGRIYLTKDSTGV